MSASVKRFERSNGLDTALYKNISLILFIIMLLLFIQQDVVTVAEIPATMRRVGQMLQPKMEHVDDDNGYVASYSVTICHLPFEKQDNLCPMLPESTRSYKSYFAV